MKSTTNGMYGASGRAFRLRIAFFGARDYDRQICGALTRERGDRCDMRYFNCRLTPETAYLAKGFDAVCLFVDDECPRGAVETLKDCGVRLILLRCAGTGNVDVAAARACGIRVARVPECPPYAVAEHAMTILMAANRRLLTAVGRLREGSHGLDGLLGLDLHGRVAGIAGTDRVGRCVARICRGYGMTVIAWDPHPDNTLEAERLLTYVDRQALFERADLLSLHAAPEDGTGGERPLVDAWAIGRMKNGAMLVNTGRSDLVDIRALIDALRAGKFHAVAMDLAGEGAALWPDGDDMARLQMFPNVVVTARQACFTRDALKTIAAETLDNARCFMEGMSLGDAEC